MHVLIVEDEAKLAADLQGSLEHAGFVTSSCADGETAWFLGDTESFDAVILDIGLPKIDGTTVLKKWRSQGRGMPVIILTSHSDWTERVQGINAGADDYLTKPFRMEELIARLHAVLRRSSGRSSSTLTSGDVVLDPLQSQVTVEGKPIAVSPLEYRLLNYLMVHSPRVVSPDELMEHIYGSGERDTNALEALIRRLRKKLGVNPIQNKRGFGYFIADVS